jgi:hypothetical protein
MSKDGKRRAEKLIKDILDLSYPFCKDAAHKNHGEFVKINNLAYKISKLIEHKEIE